MAGKKRKSRVRTIWKYVLRLVALAAAAAVAIVLLRAFDARSMPPLKIWHRVKLANEFRAKQSRDGMTFEDYKKQEDSLFDELKEKVYGQIEQADKVRYNRYYSDSVCNPGNFEQNYNRSYELIPDDIQGGILLIHGLTDSPYSMKGLADFFYKRGFYVLSMRMPGHGTVPGALTRVTWKDWMAAVRIGASHVSKKAGPGKSFYIAGYSNGGPLALLYSIESLNNDKLVTPDRLLLFSPAIGVTRVAATAKWLSSLGFIPYFEKSRWTTISPEYDPFKYNSFPLNAAQQIYELSTVTQVAIAQAQKNWKLKEFPSVTAFQSIVDSTVIAKDVVDKLYSKLSVNDNELILFDVDRSAYLENFLRSQYMGLISKLEDSDKLPYRLTIVTNADPESRQVVARTREANSDFMPAVNLDITWPGQVYSLSHVAILFPPDDPLYGLDPRGNGKLHLGNLELRGERDVLVVSAAAVARLRSNPFFSYLIGRVEEAIERDKAVKTKPSKL